MTCEDFVLDRATGGCLNSKRVASFPFVIASRSAGRICPSWSRFILSIAAAPLLRVKTLHAEPGNRGLHCALIGINEHIGRRPIAAFGNSDGDRQMLEWTQAGGGVRLMPSSCATSSPRASNNPSPLAPHA